MKSITNKDIRTIVLFVFFATIITTLLDLFIIKRWGLLQYLSLNFWEWAMFASGTIAGIYFTKKRFGLLGVV